MRPSRFHLAIPVDDLAVARAFYRDTLGLREGRSDKHWVDFDFYGHQVVLHEVERSQAIVGTNPVDGDEVPVPHFGVLLDPIEWTALRDRLVAADLAFVIEPHVRFAGSAGEQLTMFFLDPSGNALECKAFTDDDQVFAS